MGKMSIKTVMMLSLCQLSSSDEGAMGRKTQGTDNPEEITHFTSDPLMDNSLSF